MTIEDQPHWRVGEEILFEFGKGTVLKVSKDNLRLVIQDAKGDVHFQHSDDVEKIED